MKKIYKKHLEIASAISNEADRLTYLTSVLRSLLQVAVITSFEIIDALTPNDEIDLNPFAKRLCKPADGLPLEILDGIVPFLRTYIDKQFMNGWFESTKSGKTAASKELISWVNFRNSRPAHGVVDVKIAKEWGKKTELIIRSCLEVFNTVLPVIKDDSELKLPSELHNLRITTPLVRKGEAIVITSVVAKKGVWKLKAQLLSRENAEEFTIDLPEKNVFSARNAKTDTYSLAEITVNGKSLSFFHNLPIRQTSTFEGRKKELDSLAEWIGDEDSRYCLVFGDGGYGKTTLVLEFLNQFTEDQLDLNEPLPGIVSYHTAKMTRWTDEGITHFRSIAAAAGESIRELVRLFEPVIGREWYTISDRQLIDKASGVLAANKYSRDDVLLIFDNTETLAASTHEVQELGAFFKMVGKKLGRLIITSRRREFIEATPIVVGALSDQESVNLMKRLALEYNALPLNQAGESKLRKVCKQLTNKPLLIDALVKYIAHSGRGIDASLDKIFKKSNEELLEFLYADAWIRMNEAQQQVFLVLVIVSCPLDQHSISHACKEVGIQQTEFQSGLGETYFASLTDYGSSYILEIADLAKRFFLQKYSKLCPDEKQRLKVLAHNVERYALARDRIEKEYISDRVAEAFRCESAKLAKIYVDNNRIDDAIDMFELAIEDDPLNAALHDRFSWVLFNKKQDYRNAEVMAKRSLRLDPKNCDALVNMALIYYRIGDIEKGDKFIDKSRKHGRTSSSCLLRKAIARYYQSRNCDSIGKSIRTLEDALEKLESAYKIDDRSDRYYKKNQGDIQKFIALTKTNLKNLRTKQTKMHP